MTRRAHGARPRMSAALRHAMDRLREDKAEAYPGDRLVSCGIEPEDARQLVEQLYDYFDEKQRPGHPARLAMAAIKAAGDRAEDGDPDAIPLLDALVALPEGQRQTFLAMLDLMCAHAAAEGVAVGALYVAHEINGRRERGRNTPRR